MDTTLISLVLLAVLLLVNLIISSIVLSKLNKNKDGFRKPVSQQQPQQDSNFLNESGSAMGYDDGSKFSFQKELPQYDDMTMF
jgi:hypothetical protein